MSRTHDLTTGSIPGHFRTLAIPAAVGMVFTTLYNVVDVFFAGMISSEAQAGLAIAFLAFFLFMAVGIGLGGAMSALVGNAIGAKHPDAAGRIATQGISYGILACVLLFVLGQFFGPELLKIMSEPGGYRDAAVAYLRWLLFAIPGFLLAFGANGILQAQGDTVSMQRALIAAFFANVALNPLFIFGIPGLWNGFGFNGIALSTIVSQTGVMAYVMAQVFRTDVVSLPKIRALIPDRNCYRQITAQLLPISFAMIVMIAAGFIVQFHLKSFGQAAVAGYGVALRIEQLFLLPVFGLTGALLPITAQNFGAGESQRVRQALFDCWKFGLIFMCVACPTLWLAAEFLMRIFTDDPEVIRIGTSYLHVDGVILPIYMMLFAINSFLQGLKKPAWTVVIGIYRQAFGVAFFVYIYVVLLEFGVMGVWIGIATSVITGLILSLIVAHRVSLPLIGGLFAPRRITAVSATD